MKATQGKIDVFYFHWEKLNDRKTLVKLGEQAIKINLTNYCAYHGDDDFFIPESLSKCAEFLDSNSEYTSAQGRAFSFALDRDGPYGKLEKIGGYWGVQELKGLTAQERLQEISSSYWVPIFSVTHINNFIIDIGNGVNNIIDRDFGEYVNSLTIAMRGKSKFIDCLYLARNTHSRRERPTILDWITGENWLLSYTELINSISEVLSRTDKMSMIESNFEAKLQVDKLLLASKNFRQMSASHLIRKKIIEFLDNKKSISALSKFYRRIKYISISTFYLMISITKSSKSKYYRDISFIVNSCKSKHRN